MRSINRAAAVLFLGAGFSALASGQAPPPPATPPVPPPAQPGGAPVVPLVTPVTRAPETRPAGTAATVNGQPIQEVEVYRQLRQLAPNTWEFARKEILAHLVEEQLIVQYLNAIKVTIDPKDVEKNIAEMKAELAKEKPPRDYARELDSMMLTEPEFREYVIAQMKWEKFFLERATEQELRTMFDKGPEIFDGTIVRVRHILLKPGNDPAKQKEAEQKLRGIKMAIEQEAAKVVGALPPTANALDKEQARTSKIEETFSAYAKQDSECPSKSQGGDLNYFPRVGVMVEPFSKAAFAMKPFEMSDVVVTEFGYHLILVTVRKQGTPKKFEMVKEDVKLLYNMRLREAVLAQMKPNAKVAINPAPNYPQPAQPIGLPQGNPLPQGALPQGNVVPPPPRP
jgi:peptidyl-prolyl cis-trans isomerase C